MGARPALAALDRLRHGLSRSPARRGPLPRRRRRARRAPPHALQAAGDPVEPSSSPSHLAWSVAGGGVFTILCRCRYDEAGLDVVFSRVVRRSRRRRPPGPSREPCALLRFVSSPIPSRSPFGELAAERLRPPPRRQQRCTNEAPQLRRDPRPTSTHWGVSGIGRASTSRAHAENEPTARKDP